MLRQFCVTLALGLMVNLIPHRATAADAAESLTVPVALAAYTARPEPAFDWQIRERHATPAGEVLNVALVSQEWKGILWKHVLQILTPQRLDHPHHVLLLVGGGSNGRPPGDGSVQLGQQLADRSGARVALLSQVPNQPLFDGRHEDDLITETWLRYLESGDEEWPLLFPMVKSAMKAMDAVEAIARQEWQTTIHGFVITGGSKRGWTSWLTPVVDRRVVATAPMVIDVLNFRPQMKYQLETWGKYSEQIEDYTRKGLIQEGDESPRELHLRRMMDPFTYRQQLTLPKLIIRGTNDRYWVVDATRLYWDDLVGPKYLLSVPNAGHGLEGGRENVVHTLGVFFRHAVTRQPLPQMDWTHSDDGPDLMLKVTASATPTAVRLWSARSGTKDFREARWTAQTVAANGNDQIFVGRTPRPDQGHIALYAEAVFEFQGIPYSLCTLTRRE